MDEIIRVFRSREPVEAVLAGSALSITTDGFILEELTEFTEIANRHGLFVSITADGSNILIYINEPYTGGPDSDVAPY